MTVRIPIRAANRLSVSIAHEEVCLRCGHGESLHPQRDVACVACDERAQIGLPSRLCAGYLGDRDEPARLAGVGPWAMS